MTTTKRSEYEGENPHILKDTDFACFSYDYFGYHVPDFVTLVYTRDIIETIVVCLLSGMKIKHPQNQIFYLRYILYRLRNVINETLSLSLLNELYPVEGWIQNQIFIIEKRIKGNEFVSPIKSIDNTMNVFIEKRLADIIFAQQVRWDDSISMMKWNFFTELETLLKLLPDIIFLKGLIMLMNNKSDKKIDKELNHFKAFIFIHKLMDKGIINNESFRLEVNHKKKEKIVRDYICKHFKHSGKKITSKDISTEVSRYKKDKVIKGLNNCVSKYDEFSANLENIFPQN